MGRQATYEKNRMCIGSCTAPVLSDLYLAKLDTNITDLLEGTKIKKIFGYMDDYLFILESTGDELQPDVDEILAMIKTQLAPLEITY